MRCYTVEPFLERAFYAPTTDETTIEMGKGHPRDDITAESKMDIYDILPSICHIMIGFGFR